jgi:hypothetical protein
MEKFHEFYFLNIFFPSLLNLSKKIVDAGGLLFEYIK